MHGLGTRVFRHRQCAPLLTRQRAPRAATNVRGERGSKLVYVPRGTSKPQQ
jgi:hypothetical protein